MGDEGDDGEDAAWNDEIHDVVERFTTQLNCKRDSTVRRVTALVPHIRQSDRDVCAKFQNGKKSIHYARQCKTLRATPHVTHDLLILPDLLTYLPNSY